MPIEDSKLATLSRLLLLAASLRQTLLQDGPMDEGLINIVGINSKAVKEPTEALTDPLNRRLKKEMANEERIYIEERADGKYAIGKGNSQRASAVDDTQEKAVEVARQMFPGAEPDIERVRNTKTGGRDKWCD